MIPSCHSRYSSVPFSEVVDDISQKVSFAQVTNIPLVGTVYQSSASVTAKLYMHCLPIHHLQQLMREFVFAAWLPSYLSVPRSTFREH